MTYIEFHKLFKKYLSGKEIADMQKLAFMNYEDAHGYRPMRKSQKQVAYGFLEDLIYNMEMKECVDYLGCYGISQIKAEAIWKSLEK